MSPTHVRFQDDSVGYTLQAFLNINSRERSTRTGPLREVTTKRTWVAIFSKSDTEQRSDDVKMEGNFAHEDMDAGQQIELLRRQYLQLTNPDHLSLPSISVLRRPEVQEQIYAVMFSESAAIHRPPSRYQFRVLKRLIDTLERAIEDPEEDVGSPCTYRLLCPCLMLFSPRSCPCCASVAWLMVFSSTYPGNL